MEPILNYLRLYAVHNWLYLTYNFDICCDDMHLPYPRYWGLSLYYRMMVVIDEIFPISSPTFLSLQQLGDALRLLTVGGTPCALLQ